MAPILHSHTRLCNQGFMVQKIFHFGVLGTIVSPVVAIR
jgi:hypothetical protein